jgi:hypothetical protein
MNYSKMQNARIAGDSFRRRRLAGWGSSKRLGNKSAIMEVWGEAARSLQKLAAVEFQYTTW